MGYIYEGDLGIKNREVFVRRDVYVFYIIEGNEKYEYYLYVCNRESEELKRYIMFRDILRKYFLLVFEYVKLKF